MRIQIASDLHIEFPKVYGHPRTQIPAKAPAIALAGDIGSPIHPKNGPQFVAFLEDLTTRFEKVFVVAGNHEFYSAEYDEVKKKIHEICSANSKLVFLDKTSVFYDGVRVLGCTLWSDVPPSAEGIVESYINDYNLISIRDPNTGTSRRLRVSDTKRFHEEELFWLQKEVDMARQRGEKVVILTHHAPLMSGTSDPKFSNQPTNHAFATDLSRMMDGNCVKLWGFGHTHFSSDQMCNGTRVVSNQLGYLHMERVHEKFCADTVYEV